jgi:hypothetical protein
VSVAIGALNFGASKIDGWAISCGNARLGSLSLEQIRDELVRLGSKFPGEHRPTVVVETPSGQKVTVEVGEHSLLSLLQLDSLVA